MAIIILVATLIIGFVAGIMLEKTSAIENELSSLTRKLEGIINARNI